jgi:hypothetical protein
VDGGGERAAERCVDAIAVRLESAAHGREASRIAADDDALKKLTIRVYGLLQRSIELP